MQREEAKKILMELINKDAIMLASEYGIEIFKDGKKNKGWLGLVIESYLGLDQNPYQKPDFGDWELKTISLKRLKRSNEITIKETMAITMINVENIIQNDFEHSHLKNKLEKILILSRIWYDVNESRSTIYGVHEFDLTDPYLYKIIKEDYDLVRNSIIINGFNALSGKMGTFIQPRTKGQGHGSISRAFYARKSLIKLIVGKIS